MKKIIYAVIAFTAFTLCTGLIVNAQGGVGINATGAAPDNSAVLDVSGHNKGMLMPRLSLAERNAIANPAKGLFIYNTDCDVINYNAGTPGAPNWATVNASNVLTAGVSITASPVGAICTGTSVTFTAIPASGINSPSYQWQLNGGNVGTNSTSYTNANLNNGDIVTCILSTSAACVTGSPATSNSLPMTVNPIPSTPGSISGSASVCTGSSGNVYSISPLASATSYNWSVPADATIASGSGSNSITVTFGSDSGNISVNAFNSCGTSASTFMAVSVNPPAPATPGTITGPVSGGYNSTGNVYSISAVNNANTYTWTVPAGSSITSGQGSTSITVTFGTNSGNISITAGNGCGTSGANDLAVTLCNNYSSSTQTFNYSGSTQTFTVPACVFSLTIEAWGAHKVLTATAAPVAMAPV